MAKASTRRKEAEKAAAAKSAAAESGDYSKLTWEEAKSAAREKKGSSLTEGNIRALKEKWDAAQPKPEPKAPPAPKADTTTATTTTKKKAVTPAQPAAKDLKPAADAKTAGLDKTTGANIKTADTTGSEGFTPVKPDLSGNIYKTPAGPTSIEQVRADFIQKYGPTAALITSVPELNTLFSQAMSANGGKGWTTDQWSQAYKKSNFFKNDSTFRDSEVARASDAGAYITQYNNLLQQMQQSAQALGMDSSVFGGQITADQVATIDTTNNLVANFLTHHYNRPADQTTLNNYVSASSQIAKTKDGVIGGVLGDNVNALKSYAAQMGVASQYLAGSTAGLPAGADYFQNAAKAITDGNSNLVKEQDYIKQQAMNMYKPFSQRISEGQSLQALASPYLNAASNLLEVSPDTIDMGATTGLGAQLTKALQGDGTNPMTLDQWTSQLKQSPGWLNTTNARNSMMDTATQLLRNFGMVVGG